MRNWEAFVRERLQLPGLTPERETRIVRELAAQLEDFYREALDAGKSDAEADAHARRQIADWDQMARDVSKADHRHVRPAFERHIEATLDRLAEPTLDRLASAQYSRPRRTVGGILVFANFLRDSRYALRQLVRTPAFTLVAILTLGVGIGATTAIFSVVNGVLLRPLPYPEPEKLVRVHEILQKFGRFSVAPATFLDWQKQSTSFEHLSAYNSTGATLVGASGAERLSGSLVSWNFFDLLQVPPAMGRTFRADEGVPGKDTVVILSYGAWQRRFGGDPQIVGQSITLNGAPLSVIGIMPAGFTFGGDVEFYRPLTFQANPTRGGHFLAVVGRLKDGATVEQANAEIKGISERLAVQYPEFSANETAEVLGMHENAVADVRPALLTLLAAVGAVILIACANIANLLLVRASVRSKEIAVRTALGAGRARLIGQMLSESLVLALAGGIVGVGLAYFALEPIRTLSGGSIPRVNDVRIDQSVLFFALLVSLVTGVLFGLAPAWQASRSTIGTVLKDGGRSSTAASGRWVRNSLLVIEVAMSLVLLVGAVLLLRSFSKLVNVDPGFQPDRVLAFRVALPNTSYPEPHLRVGFFDTLLANLDAVPEITSAGLTQSLPMRGDYNLSFTIKGRPEPRPNEGPSANYRVISPDYLLSMGIPLVRGRALTDRDVEKSPKVVVVDQRFVERHFPDVDPLGQAIDIGNGTDGFYEIVGVVGSIRDMRLETSPSATMYVPYKQDPFSAMWVVARTNGDPAALSTSVRGAVQSIDRTLPAFAMTPLAKAVSDSVAQRRFSMLLLTTFAGIALFLAAVGLYGVVAYSVSQRTQEIGLRMAIGAQRGDVLRLVVGGGMKLVVAGLAIGLVCALALSQIVATMLFEVTPFDPPSYATTAALLLVVAALACYFPARRAMRVDPIVALRDE